MLGKMLKIGILVAVAFLLVSEPAFANSSGRLLSDQGTYIQTAGNNWVLAAKAILFLMGLGAIGFAGWNLMMDYVLAKADHEKKFSLGKLIVGMVVGSILCAPYSAILVGSDITGVQDESGAVKDDFKKE